MSIINLKVDRKAVRLGDELGVAIAPEPQSGDPVSAEFVLAIDASGSMDTPIVAPSGAEPDDDAPTRWSVAREGATALVHALAPQTTVHVVVFAEEAQLVATDTAGNLRRTLASLLPELPLYGRTNIEDCLTLSYRCLGASAAASRRVVLLSDGEATAGMSRQELRLLAAGAMKQQIYTDPIGICREADVELLRALSSGGEFRHVESTADAGEAIKRFMRDLGADGESIVVSGGKIRLTVSPHFEVLGVYQAVKSHRRLPIESVARHEADGTTAIELTLVGFGSGDERPLHLLWLRAPDRPAAAPVPILRAEGELSTGTRTVTLRSATASVRMAQGRTDIDGQIGDLVREIDLEDEIGARLIRSEPAGHEQIYEDGRRLARSRGLGELAERYEQDLRKLRNGHDANDVLVASRASSSQSVTKPRVVLRDVPLVQPRRRAPGADPDEHAWPAERDIPTGAERRW